VGDLLDLTKLPPGTILLDKYRVVETLGVGGMGVVIAADHVALGTRVAIKLLLPQLVSNESVVRRFVVEARAASRIESKHSCQVLDVGTLYAAGLPAKGVPFMVMEYLEGQDLARWVQLGKRFSVEQAIDYIVQAAEALAVAHRQGVIHRDVKPANLFLDEREDGHRVKVLDFGISKILDEEEPQLGLTKTTTVLGSGLYMSPEQMRSAKNVDFRTDIYSLGVCLYELLTGTQPFTAESFTDLAVKVNVEPPTPLRKHRPDVSDELARVIAKAYARNVADRYQDVHELVRALVPYATAHTRATIAQMVGVSVAELLAKPSLPPPPIANVPTYGGAVSTELARTETRERRSFGVVVAVGALLSLGGGVAAAVIFMRAPGGEATPALSVTLTAEPPSPPPPTPAASTVEPPPVPSVAVSPSASPSASAAVVPSFRRPPPPPPPPSAPPPTFTAVPTKPPCVPRTDPDTGLKIPCIP
jgi:serine/threonine-protein kinase